MAELWKTIIEHLSWPVIVLVLCLIFKRPLTALLDRISSIKGPGFDFSAPPASAQLSEKTIEPPQALKGEIVPAPSTVTATPPAAITGDALAARKEAIRNFGNGIPLVDEAVDAITQELAGLDMPLDSEDTARILVRHLAVTQQMLRCERTHRPIFEVARSKEPQFYGSYTFDKWIGFLIGEIAVRCDNGQYAITVYGRSYLNYIGIFAPYPKLH